MTRKYFFAMILLTICFGVLGGAISGWVLVGENAFARPQTEIITAQQFLLTDDKGNKVGMFGMTDSGPALVIGDKKNFSIVLGIVNDTARLSFFHKRVGGKKPVEVANITVKGNEPLLSLESGEGDRAIVGILADTPFLHLSKKNKLGCLMKVEEDAARLTFRDQAGKNLIHLVVREKSRAAIGLGDKRSGVDIVSVKDIPLLRVRKKGRILWFAPADKQQDSK